MKRLAVAMGCWALSVSTWGQIVVDGTRDAGYGAPLAVQTVQTGFGDAAPPGDTTGSELDAAYAAILGGRLYLLLTGNLDPNLNRLEVFIDSRAGGENVLSGTPAYDTSPAPNVWTSFNMAGLTFDAGFTADFHLLAFWGGTTDPFQAHFVDRQGGGVAQVPGSAGATPNAAGLQAAGTILAGSLGPNASGTALTQNLEIAINDTNAAGVAAGTAAADALAAAAVTTGMEFSIALADLGNPAPGSTIRIFAAIDNGDHNYLSNQVLAGLPAPQVNLGGDGAATFTGGLSGVDFTDFAGAQYFGIAVPRLPGGGEVPVLGRWGAALLGLLVAGVAAAFLWRR